MHANSNATPAANAQYALHLHAVTRNFTSGEETLSVLKGVELAIRPGELVALVGPSGSGKTTLLQIAGLLDAPTQGEVWVDGVDCRQASDAVRTRLRSEKLGFVYQFHHLLPEFSALENVMMPQLIAGVPRAAARRQALALLEQMGLAARVSHRPARLSGGEQQRVAIARAMANAPRLILADEPTGNLDPETAEQVFHIFVQAARARGLAALIATHNLDLARRMDRIVRMQHGVLVG